MRKLWLSFSILLLAATPCAAIVIDQDTTLDGSQSFPDGETLFLEGPITVRVVQGADLSDQAFQTNGGKPSISMEGGLVDHINFSGDSETFRMTGGRVNWLFVSNPLLGLTEARGGSIGRLEVEQATLVTGLVVVDELMQTNPNAATTVTGGLIQTIGGGLTGRLEVLNGRIPTGISTEGIAVVRGGAINGFLQGANDGVVFVYGAGLSLEDGQLTGRLEDGSPIDLPAFGNIVLFNSPYLDGDTNWDGVVDLEDLNAVRNNFGRTLGGEGHTNSDGVVDLIDLNNVRNNFGQRSDTLVPEPSGAALASMALLAVAWLFAKGQRR